MGGWGVLPLPKHCLIPPPNNVSIKHCTCKQHYYSGRSRGVSGVSTETPFWILCTELSYQIFKYFNKAVRSRLSNRSVTSRCNNRYSIAVALLEIIRKESKVGEKEKFHCKS